MSTDPGLLGGNRQKVERLGIAGNEFAVLALDSEGRTYHGYAQIYAFLAIAREVRLGLHEVAEAINSGNRVL